MTEFEGMSQQTLRAHWDEVQTTVELLLQPSNKARRHRFRLLRISEAGDKNQVIGEILQTPHGPVFVSRMTVDDEQGYRDEDPDDRQSSIRGIEPVTGDPGQRFEMKSRRAEFRVDAGYLLARIQAGQRQVVLEPGLTLSEPPPRPTAQQIADYRAPSKTRRRKR